MVTPTQTIWDWLAEVPDPEIPVVSVTELGIIREVAWDGDTLKVAITPTYSGCPATSVIDLMVEAKLREQGVQNIALERRLSPPWTTDWVTQSARDKLREYGIAPPSPAGGPDTCPRCGGTHLTRISQFGSTPCKAHWRCDDCLEPFDYFKCI